MTSIITAIGSLAAATTASETDHAHHDANAAQQAASVEHEAVRRETPHYGLLATTVTTQHPGR